LQKGLPKTQPSSPRNRAVTVSRRHSGLSEVEGQKSPSRPVLLKGTASAVPKVQKNQWGFSP
jgi:hypothetical protein